MKYATEQELREYAIKNSETIVVRTYENENSNDKTRQTSAIEKRIIETIIYGGLLAIRNGADKQSVKNACEYIGDLQIPEMNGYYTIYNPIGRYTED